MKRYILSSDLGKYEAKILGRNVDDNNLINDKVDLVQFRTKLYNLSDGYIDVEGNSYLVNYDGEEYIVGDQGQEKSVDTSKTNLLHKLCCYTAITTFLDPETKGNEIYMCLACPVSVLQIQNAKEEYKNFIKGDGEISITVNNKNYYFEIKDIVLKAEGSGILYLSPEIFKGKTVMVVDLGGLNQGIKVYVDKVGRKENQFIEECGTDRLLELVREQLTIYKKGNLTSPEIAEKALKDGGLLSCGKLDRNSVQYIERAKQLYLDEVLKNIKEHKINIDEMDRVVFVGGTTSHIANYIESKIPHAYIPENPQTTTVTGLYKIAYRKYKDVCSLNE